MHPQIAECGGAHLLAVEAAAVAKEATQAATQTAVVMAQMVTLVRRQCKGQIKGMSLLVMHQPAATATIID
jgi:hypothetical protein